jgi:ABC-type sugar transport system ATPase subunit
MTSPGLPLPSSLIGGPGCFSVSAGAAKSPDLGGASVANESNRPVDARVLILDEPTATLSDADIERILGILKSLRAQDRSILYITHRLGEVFELCDSVTVLRNGQHVATEPVNQVTRKHLVEQMLGRSFEDMYPKAAARSDDGV